MAVGAELRAHAHVQELLVDNLIDMVKDLVDIPVRGQEGARQPIGAGLSGEEEREAGGQGGLVLGEGREAGHDHAAAALGLDEARVDGEDAQSRVLERDELAELDLGELRGRVGRHVGGGEEGRERDDVHDGAGAAEELGVEVRREEGCFDVGFLETWWSALRARDWRGVEWVQHTKSCHQAVGLMSLIPTSWCMVPAALTRASSRPYFSLTLAKRASTSFSLVTSAAWTAACGRPLATSFSASALRPTSTTALAPAWLHAWATFCHALVSALARSRRRC